MNEPKSMWYVAAELLSLALTFPTILLAVGVVYMWGPAAKEAIKAGNFTADGWFIVGVVTAFIGSTFDNLWWFIPWTSSFLGLEFTNELMHAGVFFNVILRQAAGIFAAYCHLRAAALASARGSRIMNYLICGAYIGAAVTAFVLWMVR